MAQLAVWVSRKSLTGLMMAGHAISCFMMRQMEYDADSYEIKFAGSDAFIRTVSRLRERNLGLQFGYHDLRQTWQTGALPASLPGFLIERCARIPDELRNRARDIPTEAAGVFDTHPSDGDRVRNARAAAAAGILVVDDVPATQLFHNFDALAGAATRHHYEHDLGLSLDALRLLETDAAIQETRSRDDTRQALAAFFEGRLSAYRPIRLELAHFQGFDRAALCTALDDARRAMAGDEQLEQKYRRFVHHRSVSSDPVLFEKRIEQMERSTTNVLNRIRDALKDVPCPSALTVEAMDAAQWCRLSQTGSRPMAAEVYDRLLTLYASTLGQLAAMALRVEAGVDTEQRRLLGST